MRYQLLTFVLTLFLVFFVSRILLVLWQRKRVAAADGFARVFLGGLRMDLNQIATYAVLPAVLTPWLQERQWFVTVTGIWFGVWWLGCVFMEICTPQFIDEYDSRPNRLFVEYLKHPKEVCGMLWRGYKKVLAAGLLVFAVMIVLALHLFSGYMPTPLGPWWLRPIESLVYAGAGFLMIRGTLKKRPINPSTVAFAGDGMVNSLALNSMYSLQYAIYAMKYEMSAEDVYGKMPAEQMNRIVCEQAGIEVATDPGKCAATRHVQPVTCNGARPLNIVLIVQESLGAQYVQTLGGQPLTPNLDALYDQGWGFTRAYATGTRSVRGLEALSAGFPPTITQSVFKLPGAQSGFFTIADVLGQHHGYHSRFLYGGEAHFDNMKGFFLGNGFREVVDGPQFKDPAFLGTWGYCDEDMFNQLDRLLQEDQTRSEPALTLAFSVSNHSPWEYPQGCIETTGNPASVENTVRYADYAIGRFFDTAKTREYWDNTVFVVVADHDSRVFGADLIPLRHFHIPAVILGGTITPRRDDRLISQIDLAPTLLSLAGAACEHPMIGQDLTRQTPDRAIMQYGDRYGYLQGDRLTVLEPHLDPRQFRYTAPETFEPISPDETLIQLARAHALWPFSVYRDKSYTVPKQP
ncbi:sulfatase [Advenella sp. S44]|uniref:LTA synthase family protein n=1 Tax=Advenella sp. S44 TaxID=1982755 RepID=UPI000C29D083|nr:LTA synthase family protein [Advenella sp. S44]PJX25312.1 sulfatase [Advenella sp. S44]